MGTVRFRIVLKEVFELQHKSKFLLIPYWRTVAYSTSLPKMETLMNNLINSEKEGRIKIV